MKTLTAKQLYKQLKTIIKNGNGHKPVYLMKIDENGTTHRTKIQDCIEAEPYDGNFIWITYYEN